MNSGIKGGLDNPRSRLAWIVIVYEQYDTTFNMKHLRT